VDTKTATLLLYCVLFIIEIGVNGDENKLSVLSITYNLTQILVLNQFFNSRQFRRKSFPGV